MKCLKEKVDFDDPLKSKVTFWPFLVKFKIKIQVYLIVEINNYLFEWRANFILQGTKLIMCLILRTEQTRRMILRRESPSKDCILSVHQHVCQVRPIWQLAPIAFRGTHSPSSVDVPLPFQDYIFCSNSKQSLDKPCLYHDEVDKTDYTLGYFNLEKKLLLITYRSISSPDSNLGPNFKKYLFNRPCIIHVCIVLSSWSQNW